jgi:hypothetical protein
MIQRIVMTETKLINIKSKAYKNTPEPQRVYIGRSIRRHKNQGWGNPYLLDTETKKRDGSREEVIAKYRDYLLTRADLLTRIPELRGKTLCCWCKPEACHGDVLVELAALSDQALEALIAQAPTRSAAPKTLKQDKR